MPQRNLGRDRKTDEQIKGGTVMKKWFTVQDINNSEWYDTKAADMIEAANNICDEHRLNPRTAHLLVYENRWMNTVDA